MSIAEPFFIMRLIKTKDLYYKILTFSAEHLENMQSCDLTVFTGSKLSFRFCLEQCLGWSYLFLSAIVSISTSKGWRGTLGGEPGEGSLLLK